MSRQDKYTKELRQVLAYAREEARRLCYRLVNTEHLLLGLLKLNDPIIEDVFVSFRTNTMRISQAMEFVVGRSTRAILGETSLHPTVRAILAYATEEAIAAHSELVGVEHLLLGILREPEGTAAAVLTSFAISLDRVREILHGLTDEAMENVRIIGQYQARYDATPVLNRVSRDGALGALVGEVGSRMGREGDLQGTMVVRAHEWDLDAV